MMMLLLLLKKCCFTSVGDLSVDKSFAPSNKRCVSTPFAVQFCRNGFLQVPVNVTVYSHTVQKTGCYRMMMFCGSAPTRITYILHINFCSYIQLLCSVLRSIGPMAIHAPFQQSLSTCKIRCTPWFAYVGI